MNEFRVSADESTLSLVRIYHQPSHCSLFDLQTFQFSPVRDGEALPSKGEQKRGSAKFIVEIYWSTNIWPPLRALCGMWKHFTTPSSGPRGQQQKKNKSRLSLRNSLLSCIILHFHDLLTTLFCWRFWLRWCAARNSTFCNTVEQMMMQFVLVSCSHGAAVLLECICSMYRDRLTATCCDVFAFWLH